jgi:superfamily II DNA or RNA helicase
MRSRYDTLVGNSPSFNAIIVSDIERAVSSHRNVLVLGTRTEQLRLLQAMLQARMVDAGLVVGDVKTKDRDDAFDRQVILATASIAEKALDIPRLDTLVLLHPSDSEGFLRQASGRIDARDASYRKQPPLVLTYAHTQVERGRRPASARMAELLREIDPSATIRRVRRSNPGGP